MDRLLGLAIMLLGAAGAGDPAPLTLDLGGGVSMKLARIPAGRFLMGSAESLRGAPANERPQHEVTFERPFYLGACEVTRAQFGAFVGAADYRTDAEKNGWAFAWDGRKWDKVKGASWRKVGLEQGDDHPVVCVSWEDAQAYCE